MTALTPSDLYMRGSNLWLPFDFGLLPSPQWSSESSSFEYLLGRVLAYLFSEHPEKNASLADGWCLE
jgi:hypothetical protein